ncbi:MFS transporter [Leptobacterium flavescens]|uniref:MFS transporter n=1 Tax=Leptobacterium flavescens TaxID=472055 RepID=A0A6P0UPB4_9FLAO|nr:MFS transporter [Leptobacterium flavescens]NER15201.1 MFS transporter [Leptobacterium flavescens]
MTNSKFTNRYLPGSFGTPEFRIVFWAFIYFFSLLASYFMLRPLRDEMGIVNGAANMQWLFTGTFLSMLIVVPIFGYLSSRLRTGSLLLISYIFFTINIVLFYVLFKNGILLHILPIVFFIWLSVFNLFAISLFWSFMVDIFSSTQSKRLFGIISAGGSLGAILGPILAAFLSESFGFESLFLASVGLLLLVILSLSRLLSIQKKQIGLKVKSPINVQNNRLLKKNLLEGIRLVINSSYLRGLSLFILLYTAVSTFLYFEQAHIVERAFESGSDRIRYFSMVDLITNALTIFGQFFLTARIIRKYGLAIVLTSIPVLVGLGFAVLSNYTILTVIAIVLILHRAGNYIFLRPGREILFTISNREEKYKAKNFIDTAVYRGGDSLSGWIFAGLISMGLSLSIIAIIAIPLVAVWAYTGFLLGKKQGASEKQLLLNLKTTK